jgi:prenyl protein peptidase
VGPPVAASPEANRTGKCDDDAADSLQFMRDGEELGTAWTLAYYLLLFAGAYGFYQGLWRLTDSSNALASFTEK